MKQSQCDTMPLPCPTCGRLTDSLKQYRYVSWCVCYLADSIAQPVVHRACPRCMRRFIWRKCLMNALPAHLGWVSVLLPWAVALTVASRRPGHSRPVLEGVTPEMAMARERAEQEVSWERVSAVLSLLLLWLPVIGLVAGALACWLNRRCPGWTRRASQVGLTVSGLVHLTLAVFLTLHGMRW